MADTTARATASRNVPGESAPSSPAAGTPLRAPAAAPADPQQRHEAAGSTQPHSTNAHLRTHVSRVRLITRLWALSSIVLKYVYLGNLFVSPFTGNQKDQGDEVSPLLTFSLLFLEQFKVAAHFIYWMQQRQNLIHIIMQFANVTDLMLPHYKSMRLN